MRTPFEVSADRIILSDSTLHTFRAHTDVDGRDPGPAPESVCSSCPNDVLEMIAQQYDLKVISVFSFTLLILLNNTLFHTDKRR